MDYSLARRAASKVANVFTSNDTGVVVKVAGGREDG